MSDLQGKDILSLSSLCTLVFPWRLVKRTGNTLCLLSLQKAMASPLLSVTECICFVNSFFIIIKSWPRPGQIPCVINYFDSKCPLRARRILSLTAQEIETVLKETLSDWLLPKLAPRLLPASSVTLKKKKKRLSRTWWHSPEAEVSPGLPGETCLKHNNIN